MIIQQLKNTLLLTSFYKYLLTACTLITVLMVFVPFNPWMPCAGLDPSWVLAMNSATSQKLPIGQAIIFTFGPYSSLYHQAYHPGTYHLIIGSGLFIALCFAVLLFYLVRDVKVRWRWGLFLIFLVFFMFSRDTLFFYYPLLLACSVGQFISAITDQGSNSTINWWQLSIAALVVSPLGLLPLVKGSFLLIAAVMLLLVILYVLYYRYFLLALTLLVTPLVATPIFWILAGQPLDALPNFF